VTNKPDPPAALMAFAEELRAHREQAGISRDDLAAEIGYSSSLVGMIETGRRSPSRDFAERCDGVFKRPGTFARLEKRLRDVPFPASFRPFVSHEASAASLRSYEHSMVLGLFQTEPYARAVLATRPNTTDEEIGELVSARLRRQDVLRRDEPPLVWGLIDEGVLYREVGGSDVMRGQLDHLVKLSALPNVTIQIVPYSAGAHSGLLGAFVIAELDGSPPVAYREAAWEGETIEDPAMVAHIVLVFDTLRSEALPHGASRDLIEKVARERWNT
jgi:transcriptional regulator with XRE-family HTH domain